MSQPNEDEDISMILRRAARTETISSDIALRLAEMVFARNYGKSAAEEQLPLVVTDKGDRWEVQGTQSVPPGQRLKMVIIKVNGKIVELISW